MESLDFPVAAPVAAPIKFAWISSSRGFSQEREAVHGFSCAIVVATLAGAFVFSGTVSGTEAQRLAVERSWQVSTQNAAVAAARWAGWDEVAKGIGSANGQAHVV